MTPLLKNLRWGVFWGACGAVFYGAYAVLLYLFAGAQAFSSKGATLGGTLGAYALGGVGAGVVLGLLRPLVRWWWGAALVGFFCAIPVWLGGLLAIQSFTPPSRDDLYMVLILSGISGPVCGVIARKRWKRLESQAP